MLKLTGEINNWASIIHFTATNQNNGHFGDRIPGIWVYPGSTNLHFIFGTSASVYLECPAKSPDALDLNVWYSIEFKVQGRTAYSFINGILQQACPFASSILKYDNVIIYASDPWYPAASGMISNLVYENLDISGDE